MSAYVIAESRHIDTPDMAEYRHHAQASTLYDGTYRVRGYRQTLSRGSGPRETAW